MAGWAFANRVWNPWMGQPAALQGVGPVIPTGQVIAPVRRYPQLQPSWRDGFADEFNSACPHLWRGLKAGWAPQLGNTGSKVRDFVGHAHATLVGHTPSTIWHRNGRDLGLLMDAYNDCAEFEAGTALDDIDGPMTVSCLYMFNGPTMDHLTNRGLFLKFNSAEDMAFGLDINGSEPNLYFKVRINDVNRFAYIDVGASPGIDIVNQWVRLTGTWDGKVIRLYVDRDLKGTANRAGTLTNSPGVGSVAGGNSIGNHPTGTFVVDGQWGGTLVYNRALSPSEIGELVDDPVCLLRFESTWAGAAEYVAPGPAPEYWATNTRSRVWNTEVRSRAWTAIGRERVWIAEDQD